MQLVGLAGESPQTQSNTIRALIFNMKNTIQVDSQIRQKPRENDGQDDEDDKNVIKGKLLSTDAQMQDFLRKVTRIISLLLKDQTAPKELHKSVLKFLKVVITFLKFDAQSATELTSLILTHVFALKNSAKYTMVIRKILNKLISRVGLPTVLACTAKEHHKLVHYIERLRRKQKNAKER